MKKIILFALTLVFGINIALAQAGCSKYYPTEEGSSFQYTMYDKKGKTDGVTNYTISKVSTEGETTSATFDLKFTDKKGKELFNSNYEISCSGDGIKIDFESLFPAQMMQQYEEMGVEMDITGTDIQLPNDLSTGKVFEDANLSISMNMSGIKMNISVAQTNRKVDNRESITTSAGTFDCYLITETSTSKTMGATHEMHNKLWLAEGIGMVKQESYKKNGNLVSRMELTEFSK